MKCEESLLLLTMQLPPAAYQWQVGIAARSVWRLSKLNGMCFTKLWGTVWFACNNHRTWQRTFQRRLRAWHCLQALSSVPMGIARPASGFPQPWIRGSHGVVMLMLLLLTWSALLPSPVQLLFSSWGCSVLRFPILVHQTVILIEFCMRAEGSFLILLMWLVACC